MKTHIRSLLFLFLATLTLSFFPVHAFGQDTPESINLFDVKNPVIEFPNDPTFSQTLDTPYSEIAVPDYNNFVKPHPITYKKASEVLPYAQLALDAYSYRVQTRPGFIRVEKDQLPEDIQDYYVDFSDSNKGKLLVDSYSGLQAAVWFSKDGKEIVLAFAGTDLRMLSGNLPSARFLANLNSYIWYYLGYDNLPFLDESLIIAQSLKHHFPDKQLVILGSSLSGAQAKYCALATDSLAYTFNSLGLNAALHERLAREYPIAYARANRLITEIDLQGDLVTESLPYHLTKYPIGTTYIIPSPTPSAGNHMMNAVVRDLEHFLSTTRPSIIRPDSTKTHIKRPIDSDPAGINYVL